MKKEYLCQYRNAKITTPQGVEYHEKRSKECLMIRLRDYIGDVHTVIDVTLKDVQKKGQPVKDTE